jgi:hypothetical protein
VAVECGAEGDGFEEVFGEVVGELLEFGEGEFVEFFVLI